LIFESEESSRLDMNEVTVLFSSCNIT